MQLEKKNKVASPLLRQKKEKIKNPVKKLDKFNKKWFIEHADDIGIVDFMTKNWVKDLSYGEIYSKFLVEKKGKDFKIPVNAELYEIVYNYYINSKHPKRIAVLD